MNQQPILDFQPPALWENKFLLFKSPRLCYFGVVALAGDTELQDFLLSTEPQAATWRQYFFPIFLPTYLCPKLIKLRQMMCIS